MVNDIRAHLRLTSLTAAILAAACAPATPGGLVLHGLALAEGGVDCSEGPHPISTTDVAKLHLAMTHAELDSFETSVSIEPASRSVSLPEVPAGENWDLRLTGFISESAYQAGTYTWLGRRRELNISANQSTGAGVLLLAVEAMQCSRTPLGEPVMLSKATPLADGRVLISGGVERFSAGDCPDCRWGIATRNCTIYDPATGSFQAAAPLPNARVGHSATLLDDGRVLVLGGSNRVRLGAATSIDFDGAGLRDTALIWDPSADRWLETEAPWGKRAFHSVTRVAPSVYAAVGGFADGQRVHADLVRFHLENDALRMDEAVELACPRVGHQAFANAGDLIIWGGSRCADGEQVAPEHWGPRLGLRVSRAERWGSEANLSFGTAVELRAGTFMILGGATYRDGQLQAPNRENSYYYLAGSQSHVRAAMLPEGSQGLLGSALRLDSGQRVLLAGGFADLALNRPLSAYTFFNDDNESFSAASELPGIGGALSIAPAGENQALLVGGGRVCEGCDGGLEPLTGGLIFASAKDHR